MSISDTIKVLIERFDNMNAADVLFLSQIYNIEPEGKLNFLLSAMLTASSPKLQQYLCQAH
ncbi:hypothetical protein A4D02_27940 [Niastella koreensis]|uniref:Uncharacterized protein n=2 Tax=Niastella koreensis TaxID=354356 RepID=G8TJC6_NIAKG|nr:hypothetical protein Niako_3351 [Niastella koreensis GR20-10]OQP49910.1 hypothetical protein A4D02_27940 [Niastella koreensis]